MGVAWVWYGCGMGVASCMYVCGCRGREPMGGRACSHSPVCGPMCCTDQGGGRREGEGLQAMPTEATPPQATLIQYLIQCLTTLPSVSQSSPVPHLLPPVPTLDLPQELVHHPYLLWAQEVQVSRGAIAYLIAAWSGSYSAVVASSIRVASGWHRGNIVKVSWHRDIIAHHCTSSYFIAV